MVQDASKSVIEWTLNYMNRGWHVVPVPHQSKRPVFALVGSDCARPILNLSRYFGDGLQNIGVLLGEPSSWLVDVDLDSQTSA